jgi:hypothetical protein
MTLLFYTKYQCHFQNVKLSNFFDKKQNCVEISRFLDFSKLFIKKMIIDQK